MGKIIGIDLGTTNSLVSCWINGESTLIPNALGNLLTPSVVSIDEEGTVYVGEVAKERLITAPDRTVSVFKRSMGTERTYPIGGKWYKPEELSALVLQKLKEDAESYLGEPVVEAVVSVPAYFGDTARRATRDAGRLAGLKVDRIVNEPSAAALACQQMKKQETQLMIVYDFGGGTLDVSLVEVFENVVEIIAVNGDTHLGGSDFDRIIADEFCRVNGLRFSGLDRGDQERLLRSAEETKKKLTIMEQATMDVHIGDLNGTLTLTLDQLIGLSGNLLKRMAEPINEVLKDAEKTMDDLDQVILVGGSCKMPLVQRYIRYVIPNVPIVTANPDYMVALGAGVYAGIMERDGSVKDLVMTDICPFSLGTAVHNPTDKNNPYMSVIIPRNSALPISRQEEYSNVTDYQTVSQIGIYQGEDLYAKQNKELGSLQVEYPRTRSGGTRILVRYSYDINGLLVVRVEVVNTGEVKEIAFVNGQETDLNNSDYQEQIDALRKLHFNAREDEANQLILARAERVFAQLQNSMLREFLKKSIVSFERVMTSGSNIEILEAAQKLSKLLDKLELESHTEIPEEKANAEDCLKWLNQNKDTDFSSDWTSIN